jgi:nucleotide-binding universal stress UspA family protein
MKTLLVLIRHPRNAEHYLSYAMAFARDMELNLRVMYVKNTFQYPIGSPELSGSAMAQAHADLEARMHEGKQQIESMISSAMPEGQGSQPVDVETVTGINLSENINNLIRTGEVHMLMLKNPEDDFWYLDSQARAIVRDAKCPVWVIPVDAKYTPFKEVLYTTDYDQEDIPTLLKLIDLTLAHHPEITALHITENVDFEVRIKHVGFQKMLEEKTKYDRIKLQAVVPQQGEKAAELVNSYAERIHADLIVILQENLSFLERLFGMDHAARVLEEANRPVLLHHES